MGSYEACLYQVPNCPWCSKGLNYWPTQGGPSSHPNQFANATDNKHVLRLCARARCSLNIASLSATAERESPGVAE